MAKTLPPGHPGSPGDRDPLDAIIERFDVPEFMKPQPARPFDMADGTVFVAAMPESGRLLFAARSDISLFPLHLIPIRGDDVDAIARDCRLHGHDDWQVPAPDELALLFERRARVRLFDDHWYWSSAADGARRGAMRFADGLYHPDYLTSAPARLRLVRRAP